MTYTHFKHLNSGKTIEQPANLIVIIRTHYKLQQILENKSGAPSRIAYPSARPSKNHLRLLSPAYIDDSGGSYDTFCLDDKHQVYHKAYEVRVCIILT